MTRRRDRPRRLGRASVLPVTSMVDIFTALLLFLLALVDPSMGAAADLLLPDARAAVDVTPGVRVRLSPAGLWVEDREVGAVEGEGPALRFPAAVIDADGTVAPLREALAGVRAAAGGEATAPLILECDERVPYLVVEQVLVSARAAGFERYHLVVDRAPG